MSATPLYPSLRLCQSQLNRSCVNLFDIFTITWIKKADNLIISFVFGESYAMKSDITAVRIIRTNSWKSLFRIHNETQRNTKRDFSSGVSQNGDRRAFLSLPWVVFFFFRQTLFMNELLIATI